MPLSSPMFEEGLKVPRRASIPASTMATMMLKSTKYQYSLRLDLPLNTAYFFSASRYQLNSQPPHDEHPDGQQHGGREPRAHPQPPLGRLIRLPIVRPKPPPM